MSRPRRPHDSAVSRLRDVKLRGLRGVNLCFFVFARPGSRGARSLRLCFLALIANPARHRYARHRLGGCRMKSTSPQKFDPEAPGNGEYGHHDVGLGHLTWQGTWMSEHRGAGISEGRPCNASHNSSGALLAPCLHAASGSPPLRESALCNECPFRPRSRSALRIWTARSHRRKVLSSSNSNRGDPPRRATSRTRVERS